MTHVGDRLLLTLLVALALAWPLAAPPIGTHGEAREGLVVEDVVQAGRWILPLRNGELPSKPPLFHWIAAAAGVVVGLSDVVVRLPSALAAWVVLLAVYGLGAAAGGRMAGWLAVGALAGMHTFFESASEARVDMLFTAAVTVTLAAFLRWYRSDDARARAVCYLGAAAAVLTKGPAGAVLPVLVIVVFLATERRLDRLAALWSWRLVGLVCALDLGWYLLASWSGGIAFLERQIFHENVDRFVGRGVFGMHGGRSRLAMLKNLATDLLPWNLVLPFAGVRWWRGEREDTTGRFLHVWWIVILVFFTVAYGKRGVYLLPLYPAVAVLAGRALALAVERLRAGSASAVPSRVLAALGARLPARWVPSSMRSTPAVAGLVTIVVVVDLAVLLIGQLVRVHRAGRASLVPFASAVAALVPPEAVLVADPSLDDSDLLVLAYRLRRVLPRTETGVACVPGTYRLLTPAAGAALADVLVRSDRRGVPVALIKDGATNCPFARGSGHDR
jgi:4-amino-4-deoxy-L-arabinose transferase-like glycosyltransferase